MKRKWARISLNVLANGEIDGRHKKAEVAMFLPRTNTVGNRGSPGEITFYNAKTADLIKIFSLQVKLNSKKGLYVKKIYK